MPTAETNTKVKFCTLKRSVCKKRVLRFSVKNVSTGCNPPIHSGKENQTAPKKYVIFKYSQQEK